MLEVREGQYILTAPGSPDEVVTSKALTGILPEGVTLISHNLIYWADASGEEHEVTESFVRVLATVRRDAVAAGVDLEDVGEDELRKLAALLYQNVRQVDAYYTK